MIVAITVAGDLHALAIEREFSRRGRCDFHIIPTDRVSDDAPIGGCIGSDGRTGFLTDYKGQRIKLNDASVIWWRRVRAPQARNYELPEQQQRLIDNDCRGAVAGLLSACFDGSWVSRPEATDLACDKMHQLRIARECGFRIPDTLLSQDRAEVADFMDRHGGNVIVKPIVGGVTDLLFTQRLDPSNLPHVESFAICPAQYQQCIEGRRHIRLNCFGTEIYAASIDSPLLDWRQSLNVPVEPWPVSPELRQMILACQRKLGLKMGVYDFKIDDRGDLFWLEINPQGQFLFLEGKGCFPLAEHFTDFLISEVGNSASTNAGASCSALRG